MSDQSSRQHGQAARTFVPATEPIERRCLMSAGLHGVLAGPLLELDPPPPTLPPIFRTLPRTGGVSTQVGAVVEIGVGQRSGNTVLIDDQGAGSYHAEWNGGPAHSFTGAQAIGVVARRATHDRITINLADPSAASPLAELRQNGQADAIEADAGARPATRLRTSGTAVQTGTLLSVMVNKPTSNQVALLDQGGGAIEVEWNGGAVHSFDGVSTIVVHSEKATNDRVVFYTPPLT